MIVKNREFLCSFFYRVGLEGRFKFSLFYACRSLKCLEHVKYS